MKTVVMGAAGWLGRAVLDNLEGKHEIRAFDYGPEAWQAWQEVDGDWEGEVIHGDIADFDTVDKALEGADGVIHTAVYFPGEDQENDTRPWMINLKGLWNVLEVARRRGLRRVVHVGSCQTVHPKGVFFSEDVRRPDASLYAINKRLQEEMCRQFYEGTDFSVAVLRPDYIVDSRIGLGRQKEKLEKMRIGWVCRHDLAEACRLALEHPDLDFDVFHIVGTPEAEESCNVVRAREVLGLELRGDLEQYR